MHGQAGKGDKPRPVNQQNYRKNYQRIFGHTGFKRQEKKTEQQRKESSKDGNNLHGVGGSSESAEQQSDGENTNGTTDSSDGTGGAD